MAPPHTAALVVVGNEILSGRTADGNGPYALAKLRSLGLETRRVEVVPDEIGPIVDALQRCRAAAEHVLTSGGVGPTHDDVTVEAVAQALGVPVIAHPELESMLRAFFGARMNAARLRLAQVPQGAELLWGDARELRFPAILCDNVLVLPGVPSLFREKLDAVCGRYRAPPIALRCLCLSAGETRIAADLTEAACTFPSVCIGSYPRPEGEDHKVRVTVESRDAAAVEDCIAWLKIRLAGAVVRAE